MSATTEPTDAALAKHIADTVAGYFHARDWHVTASPDARFVGVTVTAYDEHDVKTAGTPVRFVVTVEQAP
jgi:hypothetical protein